MDSNPLRFLNRVAIVTGAGSGIGLATATQLAREGAKVIVADINSDYGLKAVDGIKQAGGEATFQSCDVGSPEQIQALVDRTLTTYKQIDIIVNNAAMMTFGPFTEIPIAQWDKVLAVNLRSVFLMCKFAVPHMKKGAIVNVSSVHAHETTANNSPYAASKGGVESLTRALSLEIQPAQARINAIAPGAVDTPMLRNNPNIESGKEHLTGRIARPEEIAAPICFLASDAASFIHGATLVVDSGRLDVL